MATPDEVILACARDLSLLDLVVLGDSALHRGLVTRETLLASSSRRRWGAARMNRAVAWMDGRSESPWESLLRVFHRVCGVPVVPQHEVFDDDGRFVARGDLWLVAAGCCTSTTGPGTVTAVRTGTTSTGTVGCWRRSGTGAGTPRSTCCTAPRASCGTPTRRWAGATGWTAWTRGCGCVEESLFHEAGRARFAARLTGPGSGRSLHRHAG